MKQGNSQKILKLGWEGSKSDMPFRKTAKYVLRLVSMSDIEALDENLEDADAFQFQVYHLKL